jgi:hypothetical protein
VPPTTRPTQHRAGGGSLAATGASAAVAATALCLLGLGAAVRRRRMG